MNFPLKINPFNAGGAPNPGAGAPNPAVSNPAGCPVCKNPFSLCVCARAVRHEPASKVPIIQRLKDLKARAKQITSDSPTASLLPAKLKLTVPQLKAAADQQGAMIRGKKRGPSGALQAVSAAATLQGARSLFAHFDGGFDSLQRDYNALDLRMRDGGVFVESDGTEADVATFIKGHSEHLFELTLEEALDGTLDSCADRLNDLLYAEWEHDKMLALEHMPQGRRWATGADEYAAMAGHGGGGG